MGGSHAIMAILPSLFAILTSCRRGVIGGSRREERLEVLDRRMAECSIDREHYA
jgi:hypothetical protein